MNYLAHAYLTGQRSDGVLMGNMMGDFVKGSQYKDFEEAVQEGILLHRAIDEFTDAHPAVSAAKNLFRPYYRLYSGVFTDIFFDHFLANDTKRFQNATVLMEFTQYVYHVMDRYRHLMNEKMTHMTFYMIQYNWLYHYKTIAGIEKSFIGLAKRRLGFGDPRSALKIFTKEFAFLEACYQSLISDLEQQFYR